MVFNLQSNTVTKKNSGSRNLHRLLTAVLFVSGLLQNMAKDSAATLRQVTCSTAKSNAANGFLHCISVQVAAVQALHCKAQYPLPAKCRAV